MKKSKKSLKTQLTDSISLLGGFIAKYRVTIMVIVFGAVLGLSLYRASVYGTQTRNQAKYDELVGENQVIIIDTDLIERIRESVDAEDPQIGSRPAPGRTNPFTE